jgi:hypothetical protein
LRNLSQVSRFPVGPDARYALSELEGDALYGGERRCERAGYQFVAMSSATSVAVDEWTVMDQRSARVEFSWDYSIPKRKHVC